MKYTRSLPSCQPLFVRGPRTTGPAVCALQSAEPHRWLLPPSGSSAPSSVWRYRWQSVSIRVEMVALCALGVLGGERVSFRYSAGNMGLVLAPLRTALGAFLNVADMARGYSMPLPSKSSSMVRTWMRGNLPKVGES